MLLLGMQVYSCLTAVNLYLLLVCVQSCFVSIILFPSMAGNTGAEKGDILATMSIYCLTISLF